MEAKTATRKRAGTENAVTIKRVINLPVSKVWRAFTDETEFKKWWGPNGYTCPSSSLEPRVGGKYFKCMRSPDGKDNWSVGTVKKFVPEKTLVITDSFADENGNIINANDIGMPGNWPDQSLITIQLEEANGATKFKLIHEGIPEEAHDDCVQGWNESLDKLEKNI